MYRYSLVENRNFSCRPAFGVTRTGFYQGLWRQKARVPRSCISTLIAWWWFTFNCLST